MSVEEQKITEIEETQIPEGAEVSLISKNEKKARKLLLKLDLKKIPGITRVTFKRKGNIIVAIEQPEVYRSPAGSYIVFGEAKVEDFSKRYAEAAAAQAAAQESAASAGEISKDPASITADLEAAAAQGGVQKAEDDDEEVDETGVNADDIDLVMQQTNVSRAKAVKALKEHDGDMVNAIMSFTS
ncbi:hypothetical protein B5S28_g560 [[Candida] boidinii]|uniref:Unnamed protein product n=1 Tax=Candida boidinii TaxID=5477 RepID=A0ACB5TVK5_CANBO|nr:hypothetical protein B5S28_g560 [[Candida] boidinii]OWB59730.1 hypothetical protein B5S29_g592 [[Candida] boidinii]OWB73172.1 hypothetical protein B5S31_g2905 [[Candida] boidinii]OWB79005.1 hypothetical protein B5S32_g3214 [[Candida] boidinii]GME95691.1 unnamed protein product [[Candida] boidinii]